MTDRPPLLPTYSDYKPAGIPWLDKIPAHWEVAAVKWNYSIQLGKMLQNEPKNPADVETPYLKAQHVHWFSVRTTDAPTMWASERDIEHFGIRKGDLLVCEGGEGGRSAIVGDVPPGCIIQNALHRVRPRGNCRNDYLLYVMSEIGRAGWFDAINNAVTIPHFTVQKFRSLKVPIPPIEEQVAIARYLNHKNALIQRFLQGKQRMLDLLKQLRKSTIHYAVIHGLDPKNTPMKPSGIQWIDEIPAHWETRRLKFSASNVTQMTSQRNEDDLTLALENVESWSGKYTDAGPDVHFDSKLKRFQARDVLFGKLRPYLAKVVLPDRNGLCVGEFLVLRARENVVLPEYLWMLLRSPTVIDIISGSSFGAKMPRADWRFVGAMRLPVPPLEEQAAIAEYLIGQVAKIDAAIAVTIRIIDQMRQYRKSLIHEVVTGVRDVRKAAAAIPDDPDNSDA